MMNSTMTAAPAASTANLPTASKLWIVVVILDVRIDDGDNTSRRDAMNRLSVITQRMHKRFAHFLSVQRADIAFGDDSAAIAITKAATPSATRTTSLAWDYISRQAVDRCPRFKEECEQKGVIFSDNALTFVADVALPGRVVMDVTMSMIRRAKAKSLESHPCVDMNISVNFMCE